MDPQHCLKNRKKFCLLNKKCTMQNKMDPNSKVGAGAVKIFTGSGAAAAPKCHGSATLLEKRKLSLLN